MLEDCARHKLNTDGDFFYTENYLKLDNTNQVHADRVKIVSCNTKRPCET